MYRAREGMWSWILHRVAGVAIVIFLMAHIVDTSLVGWGPRFYNEAVNLYRNPLARIGEILLIGAVLFHAVNGVRIILINFVPNATRVQRRLFYAVAVVFLFAFIPGGYILARAVLH